MKALGGVWTRSSRGFWQLFLHALGTGSPQELQGFLLPRGFTAEHEWDLTLTEKGFFSLYSLKCAKIPAGFSLFPSFSLPDVCGSPEPEGLAWGGPNLSNILCFQSLPQPSRAAISTPPAIPRGGYSTNKVILGQTVAMWFLQTAFAACGAEQG